jgi:hypothetical protein
MRYRLMATFRGVPYEVGVGPSNSELILFAACPPPEELGFEPATGHWRKPVIRAQIDALWESRPVGMFRGEPCIVLDDPGDRLHIAYLGTDAERATSLGYWQVDRGVFELLTPREEVTELTEERVEKALRWGELAEATGPMATYPYGTAPWPVAAPLAPAPDAAFAEETVPGAGRPLGDAGAADVPPAGTQPAEAAPADVPPADVPPADVPAARIPPADVPAPGARAADVPVASIPPAKTPVSATPLADALMAETQLARRTATPLASAPPAPPPADDPMAARPARAPLASAPLAAPLADDPMASRPAGTPLASVPPASVSPETVASAPVPVPSAVSAAADDGAQAATGSWPAYPGAETDPHPSPISVGDALSYPDEGGSPDLPVPPGFYDPPEDALAGLAPEGDIGGRAARRQRVPTREIFCELADLASIPRSAYALETETDGAMCLLPTPDGFDVFIAADGARHELRSFADEEAAYFYLFGVLAADAVRSGALAPAVTTANPHGGPA